MAGSAVVAAALPKLTSASEGAAGPSAPRGSGTDPELQGGEAAVLNQPGETSVQCVNNPCTPHLPDPAQAG